MGRPAKPVDILLLDGNTHLTKSEIERRRAAEAKQRNKVTTFHPSLRVKDNPVAYKMFKKLKKLYKEAVYVDGADEQIINRYCLLTAEIDSEEALLDKMNDAVDKCEDPGDMVKMYQAITGMDKNIKASRDMLLKMEDRLLLNPTARIKNVPKKIKEDETPSKFGKFGNRGSQSG